MIISNINNSYIKVQATEIADLIANPSNYTKMEVTAILQSGVSYSQSLLNPFSNTSNLLLLPSDSIRINPTFFGSGLTTLSNGVYHITVKLIKPSEYILITNCAFIDVDLACRVGKLLNSVLTESDEQTKASSEKLATLAHTLHYALVNGSNCNCNCTELSSVYLALIDTLNNIDPSLVADCKC